MTKKLNDNQITILRTCHSNLEIIQCDHSKQNELFTKYKLNKKNYSWVSSNVVKG